MSTPPDEPDPRVCNLPDGEPDWDAWDERLEKIVLGKLDKTRAFPPLPGNFAERFPNLTHLHLWGLTGIKELPALPDSLRCLDVRKCVDLERLPELPEGLETLDAEGCVSLAALPDAPGHALTEVFLGGCVKAGSFAPLRATLPSLKRLELHGCKFDDLPEMVCGEARENVLMKVSGHLMAIKEQGAASLPECKIVILGNGGVGKTSLVRALKGLPHREGQKETEGIRLWSWDGGGFVPFPQSGTDSIHLNIWDFGGQDLYHNTHRLFLESRAVFVIVWRQPRSDGSPFRREHPEDPVRPLDYWLDQIYAVNREAPVLLVRTGLDEDESHPPGDWMEQVRPELRGKMLGPYEISCVARNLGDLDRLRHDLLGAATRELRGAEAVRLGQGRLKVRERLRQWQPACLDDDLRHPDSARPLLRVHEFEDLVGETYRDHGLGEPHPGEADLLLDYLHHAGAVYCPASWRDAAGLAGAFPVILDQRWAIEGIYELFRPGDIRETLIALHGRVTREDLATDVWGQLLGVDGAPRYDATAQWVFLRFMESCGVVVRREEDFVIPELLPDWKALGRLGKSDPLVAALLGDHSGRTYVVRHRALGQGFGCMLVGRLSELFGKVPLYRYGAIGRLEVGGGIHDRERGPRFEVIARIEWVRETQDAYHGDVIVTVVGDASADSWTLAYLEAELGKIPGFPPGAEFALPGGPLPEILRQQMSWSRLPSREEFVPDAQRVDPARSLPRLGVVGFSVAGEDATHPGIEILPRALESRLARLHQRSFDVLYYKSDAERITVSQLIGDLVKADLVIAFLGTKYLYSEYCMVELLQAARFFQDVETFTNPEIWPHRVWLLNLPDCGPLIGRTDTPDSTTECEVKSWLDHWIDRSTQYSSRVNKEFRGKGPADKQAPAKYVFHSWMRYAEDGEEGLNAILASIRQKRLPWQPGTVPEELGEQDDWAAATVEALAEAITKRMGQIIQGFSPMEKMERAKKICVRYIHQDKWDDAADAFERWLNSHENPAAAREDAFANPLTNRESQPMEPARTYWCRRQGRNADPKPVPPDAT